MIEKLLIRYASRHVARRYSVIPTSVRHDGGALAIASSAFHSRHRHHRTRAEFLNPTLTSDAKKTDERINDISRRGFSCARIVDCALTSSSSSSTAASEPPQTFSAATSLQDDGRIDDDDDDDGEANDRLWFRPEGEETGIVVKNSLTRSKVPLIVKGSKCLSWYVCGPTVYDDAHIGEWA